MLRISLVFFLSMLLSVPLMKAQTGNDPYVILVEFTVDEKNKSQVVELLSEVQQQTLDNEEGCLVYDILLSEEDPTKIFLYESYESDAAYKIHSGSSYFKTIVEKQINPLLKGSKITKVTPVVSDSALLDEEV